MSVDGERSHYQVLGVRPGVGTDEIRRAHRQLARVLHPDRQAGVSAAERTLAERRMREVNAAWDVLSDPVRRSDYDAALGRSGSGTNAARPRTGNARGPGGAGADGGVARPPGEGAWDTEDDWDDDAFGVRRAAELEADEEPLPAWQFWLLRRGPVVAAVVVALGIFVFSAYAGSGGAERSGAPAARDCVRIMEGNGTVPAAAPVPCGTANDGRIVAWVPRALDCAPGTRYVLVGERFACVQPPDATASDTGGGTGRPSGAGASDAEAGS